MASETRAENETSAPSGAGASSEPGGPARIDALREPDEPTGTGPARTTALPDEAGAVGGDAGAVADEAGDSSMSPDRADGRSATVTVRLFDADRTDSALDLDDALQRHLSDRQLLWIDVEGPLDPATSEAIARRMDLKPRTRNALERPPDRPHIALHGAYFHVRVATEADHDPKETARWIDLLAATQVVVSSHVEPIELLRQLDDRIETDATVGQIDAAAFVRSILDAAVTSYFEAVDAIEDVVDDLDHRALSSHGGGDVLADLVAVRRRIGRLRRVLSAQREVFAALAAADFGAAAPTDDTSEFRSVAERFENALRSVEDSRDLLLGSFDVFMTRTAQRTNEVMKVLALATVLLLPGSLIAGLLGMNVDVPLAKDDPSSFWLVVATIAALAVAVLVVARIRRWI